MNILKALGGVVDSLFPLGTGNRTKVAVLLMTLLPVVKVLLPKELHSICDEVVKLLGGGVVPALALAGLVRNK